MTEYPVQELKIILLEKYGMVAFKEELGNCPFYEFIGNPLKKIATSSAPISHRNNRDKYFYDVTNTSKMFLNQNSHLIDEITVRILRVQKPNVKPKEAKKIISLIDCSSSSYRTLSNTQKKEIGNDYYSLISIKDNEYGLIPIVSMKGYEFAGNLYLILPDNISEETKNIIGNDVVHFVQLYNNIITPEECLIQEKTKSHVMRPIDKKRK